MNDTWTRYKVSLTSQREVFLQRVCFEVFKKEVEIKCRSCDRVGRIGKRQFESLNTKITKEISTKNVSFAMRFLFELRPNTSFMTNLAS